MRQGKKKMLRAAALCAALLGIGAPASALDMMVWDGELQTKLAYGQTAAGEKLRGQVLQGAGGPVVVLFSLSDAEKSSRAFANLQTRYEGEIKDGKLLLKLPGGVQTLEKFLAGHGLELELKPVKPKPAGTFLPKDGFSEGQWPESERLNKGMNLMMQMGIYKGGR